MVAFLIYLVENIENFRNDAEYGLAFANLSHSTEVVFWDGIVRIEDGSKPEIFIRKLAAEHGFKQVQFGHSFLRNKLNQPIVVIVEKSCSRTRYYNLLFFASKTKNSDPAKIVASNKYLTEWLGRMLRDPKLSEIKWLSHIDLHFDLSIPKQKKPERAYKILVVESFCINAGKDFAN